MRVKLCHGLFNTDNDRRVILSVMDSDWCESKTVKWTLSGWYVVNLLACVAVSERALYVFEGAFHPRFNIATGNCRLDFRRQENRSLIVICQYWCFDDGTAGRMTPSNFMIILNFIYNAPVSVLKTSSKGLRGGTIHWGILLCFFCFDCHVDVDNVQCH